MYNHIDCNTYSPVMISLLQNAINIKTNTGSDHLSNFELMQDTS